MGVDGSEILQKMNCPGAGRRRNRPMRKNLADWLQRGGRGTEIGSLGVRVVRGGVRRSGRAGSTLNAQRLPRTQSSLVKLCNQPKFSLRSDLCAREQGKCVFQYETFRGVVSRVDLAEKNEENLYFASPKSKTNLDCDAICLDCDFFSSFLFTVKLWCETWGPTEC